MLTGTTKNLGVMGWPIAHSLSPVIQMAAIEAAGLDYAYIALPVKPGELPQAVAGLKALQFRGWNVTIPHKQAIMPLMDDIDEAARTIGAVNTVVNDNGHLTGYNTDCVGAIMGLQQAGFDVQGKKVVMLGGGGAARAVIWGLLQHGASRVTIGARNPAKIAPLAKDFAAYGAVVTAEWHSELFQQALGEADLLINTTPLGMAPKVDAAPPVDWQAVLPTAFVYDIIYTPEETLFLRQAREHGHRTLNGEYMLAGQGAASLYYWTGVQPDLQVMQQALHRALLLE